MNKKIKKGLMYGITANVILLSLTSLLTDISSEIITPLIPLFITSLGASALIVGILGGLSDSVAGLFYLFSGYWSDLKGKRKSFIIGGYSISALTKLFMSLATSWIHIFILRPIERIGKGMRDPPRDTLLAETTPKEVHGKVFGINRAFDRTGAILGSILAIIFLALGFSYNKIFFIAALIAFLSVIPLFFVKEKKTKPKKVSLKIGLKSLPKNLKLFIIVSTIFSLASFSYMFFILKTIQLFPAAMVVALYLLSNVIFELFATPAGILADKIGKKKVIVYGYILFVLACLIFILSQSLAWLMAGFALYGLSQALSVSNERAFVADLSPKKELGTSIGTFYTFNSLAALPAGIIAGLLWQYVNPSATFIYGAALSLVAALVLAFLNINEKMEMK